VSASPAQWPIALRLSDTAAARRLRALPELVDAPDRAEVLVTDGLPMPGDPPCVIVLAAGAVATRYALRAGARAVLPPEASAGAVAAVLPALGFGLAVLPAPAAEALADGHAWSLEVDRASPWRADCDAVAEASPVQEAEATAPRAARLTPREREVLSLLASGASNKVIARRLGLSFHTAKAHVASVLHKLGAASRADAVARGARAGLVLL
jgi:DNA-binding NarL/FixJ family response regulator